MPKYLDGAGLSRFWNNIKGSIGNASQAQVDAWLDNHPEATTTVQDGSISTRKIADNAISDNKLMVGDISATVAESFGYLLSKVNDRIVFSVQVAEGWTDLPAQEMHIVVNIPYSSIFRIQIAFGYASGKIWWRIVNKNSGDTVRQWSRNIADLSITNSMIANEAIDPTKMSAIFGSGGAASHSNLLSNATEASYVVASASDGWQDLPLYGNFIIQNVIYGSFCVQIAFSLNTEPVPYIRIVNTGTHSVYRDWVPLQVVTASGISHDAPYSTLDYKLSKVNTGLVFHVSPNDGWEDMPSSETGIMVNMSYSRFFNIQLMFSLASGNVWKRIVNPNNGSVSYDWVRLNAFNKVANSDKVAFIGDSITAGSWSDGEGGHAATNPEWCYPRRIGEAYGCQVQNLAVPGMQLIEMSARAEMIDNDCTVVVITGGSNDYTKETPFGTIESSVDNSTIYGAIKNIVETAISQAPNARIVLLSPWIVAAGTASTRWSYDYEFPGNSGWSYSDLETAYREVARLYLVEYIDGTVDGPVNVVSIEDNVPDGFHPTKEFYAVIASWLGGKLF